jgi:DNA-binding PucR family transcriptional regulator
VAVVKQKLQDNHRCLYFDSPAMLAGLRSYLAAGGVDVINEVAKGSLVLSSDQGHLVAGQFDVDGMIETLKSAVEQALEDSYSGLWAAGDMTWEFGPHRDFSKLLEYECKLEEFIRQNSGLGGICIYHADTLPRDAMRQGLLTHGSIFVNETLSKINPHFMPPNSFTHDSGNQPELDSALDKLCSFDS